MARDVEAGRAFVRVSIKDDLAGLKRVSAKLKSWGASIGKLGGIMSATGAAALGPILAMTQGFAAAGDQIDKVSTRMGVSAEFASALAHAASLGGSSLEDMEKAFRTMSRTAEEGNDAFEKLSVSTQNADGSFKTAEQLFQQTTAALSRLEDETLRSALAQQIFGRSGTMLLPMLTSGVDGINAMMRQAEELGIVMSGADAKSAAALTDAMGTLKSAIAMVKVQIGAALAPALTEMSGKLTAIVSKAIAWAKANRQLVVMIAKIGGMVMAAGAAVAGLGGAMAVAGVAISGIVSAITAIGAVIGTVLSPLGLLVAGIAGGTAAFLTLTETGQQVMATLQGKFAEIAAFAKETFGGIVDAIKAGDFELAFKIVTLSAQQAWTELKIEIMQIWVDLQNGIIEATSGATNTVLAIWRKTSQTLAQWFSELGYRVTLMMSGEKNYLTDEERRSARDSALNEYYDDLEGRLRTTLTEPRELDTSELESQLEELRRARDAAISLARQEAESARQEQAAKTEQVQAAVEAEMAVAPTAGKNTTAGTFSAYAASIMGQGVSSEEKQTAENTRETVRELRRIRQSQGAAAPTFA